MAEQKQVSKQTQKKEDAPEETEAKDLSNVALDEDVTDILDEIDGVLEENAEEFVRGYIQKGGE
jgi:prokaryotic ubiquitin-like protein Pup